MLDGIWHKETGRDRLARSISPPVDRWRTGGYEIEVEVPFTASAVIENTGTTHRVHSLYHSDASLEIDGYENSEHKAY